MERALGEQRHRSRGPLQPAHLPTLTPSHLWEDTTLEQPEPGRPGRPGLEFLLLLCFESEPGGQECEGGSRQRGRGGEGSARSGQEAGAGAASPPILCTHRRPSLSIPLGSWGWKGPTDNPRAGTLTVGIDGLAEPVTDDWVKERGLLAGGAVPKARPQFSAPLKNNPIPPELNNVSHPAGLYSVLSPLPSSSCSSFPQLAVPLSPLSFQPLIPISTLQLC